MAREDSFIIHKIWDELSQINMHKINRVCQTNFQICVIGSMAAIEKMTKWLASFPYHDLNLPVPNNEAFRSNKEMVKRLLIIQTDAADEVDEDMLRTSDFCIVESSLVNVIRQKHAQVYPFNADDRRLAAQILANNENIRFALSHNFPVFRPEHAKIEIQETAIQNTAWVLISALPAYLPAPHRTIVAPLETFADFLVLTVNEIKLMFELIGLLGEKIQFRHIIEFVFVFGLAKIARESATLLLRVIPFRGVLVAKGAFAYAFTWAIGEAIVFFIVARQKVGIPFILHRMKARLKKGVAMSAALLKKRVSS